MDSQEPPPAKRQRTDSDDEAAATPPVITRSPKFWFEDGTIILQIESTQYRVHKSILSLHSNTFKDLFQVPQPENEPLIEGCQVLQLVYDSPQDMAQVLSLIYYRFIENDTQKNLPFPMIAAIIRLGRKYEFTQLQAIALRRLQILFPKTLSADWLRGNPQFTAEYLFDVVNLAEESSINSILPAAFLQVCMTCSLDAIVNGIQRKDGTQIRLNHRSMASCILGREKLTSQLPKSLFPSLLQREPADNLRDLSPSERCSGQRVGLICGISAARMAKHVFFASLTGSKMKFLRQPEAINELPLRMCEECKKSVVSDYTDGRKSIWDELPTFFGFPNWGDLKDF